MLLIKGTAPERGEVGQVNYHLAMVRIINDEKWAPIVGKFMIAFGSIEKCVNELLRHQCGEAHMRFALTLMLAQRFKLLRELLSERSLSDVARSVLIANLDDAQELVRTRNLVAHNPLVLSMFHHDDEATRTMREVIYAERNGKAIEFEELIRLTDRATKVAAALAQNWIELDMAQMEGREPMLTRT